MEELKKDPYQELGVSSKKEGVHEATKDLSKGLYPGAFCQVVPVIGLPPKIQNKYAQVIHSDGVGTKSNVAYLAMKEGLGTHFLHSLPQDAIVMNTDDMACVGITNDIVISNHIARNANRVDDAALAEIINGYAEYYQKMAELGINLYNAGGETADVGSYTTTMGLDVTASAIIAKEKIIDCSNIKPGEYIVGLASYGQSTYENSYNSGIRSNGLTLAINSLLSPYYRKYKEVMDGTIAQEKLFTGVYKLEDKLDGSDQYIVEALLSPTRTYLPVLDKVLNDENINVSGIIHCSGGGLTKSINFGKNIRYIKNNLGELEVPAIFKNIQDIRGIDDNHMYQTFNMGVGMEIIVPSEEEAKRIIKIAQSFDIDAAIIGKTGYTKGPNEVIIDNGKRLAYTKNK